ncbi:hypothetical protein [Magnetospirillum aberrantis]|uniref:Uncharacterized protein n=1 Tax=Magnetospirillum aberrantis SpK TaxID=908842 RepID=A0A7C9QTN4_9PROT|nr:hypothetical protein [Magnetospirillum aberrantis]NFV80037.1 hypothetical protein [Magnetospirillum aberrantis SpK]
MAGRVYIPSAQAFGTVTGRGTYGFGGPAYLIVRVDDSGDTVKVLERDTEPTNVFAFPARPRRVVNTPIRTPDGPSPSAA